MSPGLDHPAGYRAVDLFTGRTLGSFRPGDTFAGTVNPTSILLVRCPNGLQWLMTMMSMCDHCHTYSSYNNTHCLFPLARFTVLPGQMNFIIKDESGLEVKEEGTGEDWLTVTYPGLRHHPNEL
jgi:hypothetical protein